jgi:hypothetical protein
MSKEQKLVEDFRKAELKITREKENRTKAAIELFGLKTGLRVGVEVEERFCGNRANFVICDVTLAEMGDENKSYLWKDDESGVKILGLLGKTRVGSGKKKAQAIIGDFKIIGETKSYKVGKKE